MNENMLIAWFENVRFAFTREGTLFVLDFLYMDNEQQLPIDDMTLF